MRLLSRFRIKKTKPRNENGQGAPDARHETMRAALRVVPVEPPAKVKIFGPGRATGLVDWLRALEPGSTHLVPTRFYKGRAGRPTTIIGRAANELWGAGSYRSFTLDGRVYVERKRGN